MKTILTAVLAFSLIGLTAGNVYAGGEAEKELLKKEVSLPDVLSAMKDLSSTAAKIVEESGAGDVNSLKSEVEAYYRSQFGEEYKKKNNGATYPKLDTVISELVPNQVVAQNFYIAKNSNPLGSKHLLNKAEDKSTYSQLHAKYHPHFRSVLDENGLYDTFLVNTDGQVVYTVYKELDFFDNLKTGENAQSGLGEAFQKALKAKKGEVVESRVDKYGFSYDVLALFIGAPIYDGDKLLGAFLYQVNP